MQVLLIFITFLAIMQRIVNELHSKKGIVILTSGLLYEFQMSAQQRAKLVCVSGVHQECGKHISAVSRLSNC